MADNERPGHVNIVGGDANLVNTSHIIQVSGADMGIEIEVEKDILQQAFQEASGPLVQDGVAYGNGDVADATSNISLDGTTVINAVKNNDVIYTLHNASRNITADSNGVQDLQGLVDNQIASNNHSGFLQEIVTQNDSQQGAVSGSDGNYIIQLQNQANILQGELVAVGTSENVLPSLQATAQETSLPQIEPTQLNSQVATEQNKTQTIIVQAPSTSNTAPLGSSANPIRIVQQGNQYTSLQQLSAEQLSHIMQVVQQQQLMKMTTESNKPSVIFNPQTQTRIVYKVMYPSELHNQNKNSKSSKSASGSSGKRQPHQIYVPTESVLVTLPKRTYKKRKHDEDGKVEAPELSKEEKEEKKKHRPRTRSGRISRPPRHMVKDYKHIHPVDWDEDYDDSDGGYSDFKGSSGEEDELDSRKGKKDSNYTAYSCLGPHGKAKPWKCKVCDKAYIGKAGLARHYRLNPEHGKDDENFKEGFYVNGTDDGSSRDSAPDLGDGKKFTSQSGSQDQDGVRTSFANCTVINTSNVSSTASAATDSLKSVTTGVNITSNKHVPKTKQAVPPESASAKKKARLKEYIRDFTNEDLMETVFPRLAQAVSTWEFMLMKAERGRPARPQLVHLLQEYVQIYKQIRQMCEEQLQLVQPGSTPSGSTKIQVSDEKVASALGVSVGLYSVQTKPAKDDTFRYKLLTTDPVTCTTPSNKRTLEMVSVEDLRETKQNKQDEVKNMPNTNKTTDQAAAKILPGQTLLKSSLLSSAGVLHRSSSPSSSMADMTLINSSSVTESSTEAPDSVMTGSIHQMEALQSNETAIHDDTEEGSQDFNVVIMKSDSSLVHDSVTHGAMTDKQASDFMESNPSSSPMFSVCFVSSSTVAPAATSTATTAVSDEILINSLETQSVHNTEQSSEITQHSQLLDQPEIMQVDSQELGKPVENLLENSEHLLQKSETALQPDEQLLGQSKHHEEQPDHLLNQSVLQSEQSGEQSNQHEQQPQENINHTEQLKQALEKNEHSQQLVDQSEQSIQGPGQLVENHHEQLMEQSGDSLQPTAQLMEQSEQLMKDSAELIEDGGRLIENDGITDQSSQLAGEMQLGVTMSLPPCSMSYNSQYVDSEMSEHLVSDGLILTDDGNGQVLLEENMTNNGIVFADHNTEQSEQAALQDLNADNRLILIKNPDGTIQVHGQSNQPISLEQLQALLGVELGTNVMAAESPDQVIQ